MLTTGYFVTTTSDPIIQLLLVAVTLSAEAYAFMWVTWVFYLALMNLQDNLAGMHPFVRANAYAVLAAGYPMDIILNVTIGTALFLQLPHPYRLLFTARLEYNIEHSAQVGYWRWAMASWLCGNLLDPFTRNRRHCRVQVFRNP